MLSIFEKLCHKFFYATGVLFNNQAIAVFSARQLTKAQVRRHALKRDIDPANGSMQALQKPAFQEYRGSFSGTVIRSPQVCTTTDGRPCHMVTQIPVCNKLLYNVRLELQEFAPGQLGIEVLDYIFPYHVIVYDVDQAFRLLSCLFSNHSCIASLRIKYWNYPPKYEEMVSS
ncbi:hypothetical protein HPB48_003208 [Haemaphysalis longicornis]|uniref:Uncharacterized protein n=1 Tax=Haemaphysalis longicornis TaxID=44386 RepID=A0A9J6GMQ3_HAELO|nr:hypothetical protein HPB48_003208 [Haemaphysalis longicornis]